MMGLTERRVARLKPCKREYTLADPACPGLRLRIHPGGGKSWVTSERVGGKPKRITLGSWPQMTIDAAREALRTRRHGPPSKNATSISFADLVELCMAQHACEFKPSTYRAFMVYLNSQLLPAFGSMDVHDLRAPEVARWFYEYSRVSPGGANQALGHLCTIWNWGLRQGHIPEGLPNPTPPIRKNRRRARGQSLSASQIGALCQVLDRATGAQWLAAQAVRLILFTGCRKGEILALRWQDVRQDRLILRDAKTGPRDVILNPQAQSLIKALEMARMGEFLFPSARSGSGHLQNISASWARFKAEANLPEQFRVHDLRHTYASHAILSGETLLTTGKLLGHASARSTERYAHLSGATLAQAANTVSEKIAEAMFIQ